MHVGTKLDELVAFIGHLVGAAHVRGVASLGGAHPRPWTREGIDAVVDHAVVLAGALEGVYLAWVRRNG